MKTQVKDLLKKIKECLPNLDYGQLSGNNITKVHNLINEAQLEQQTETTELTKELRDLTVIYLAEGACIPQEYGTKILKTCDIIEQQAVAISQAKPGKQPDATELTKKIQYDYNENGACGTTIYKLCAEIDAQAAEIETLTAELEKRKKWHDFFAWEREYNKLQTKLQAEIETLTAELEKLDWKLAEDMPEILLSLPTTSEDEWNTHFFALEHDDKIPKVMTAAQIWMDEGSEVEYWRPIILPQENQNAKD